MRKLFYAISMLLTMGLVWTGCSEPKPIEKFTVTFDSKGGSAVSAMIINKGAKITKPSDPTNGTLVFVDWFKEDALTTEWDFSSDVVTANITLYAKWSATTREALQELATATSSINSKNYTIESYNAMASKRDAAQSVLNNSGSTPAQIITAYTELQAAIDALVALPVREAVRIELHEIVVDGFVYVNSGEDCYIGADAVDAQGDDATDSRVTFSYDKEKLAAWAEEGSIRVNDDNLNFTAKPALIAGETIEITIASASKPEISMTVTLKVAAVGEVKAQFLEIVNALPEPSMVTYSDYEAIDKADDIHEMLSDEDLNDAAVIAAYEKLQNCYDALDELPERLNFSFNGNVCTLTMSDFGENITFKTDFIANEAFPQGTYTDQNWEYSGPNYTQYRMEFNSDGAGVEWYRTSPNANGTDPTAWVEIGAFTYTFSGTTEEGGTFYVTYSK